jgi:hypothetical protein
MSPPALSGSCTGYPSPQVGAVGSGTVGFVGQHPIRCRTGPAATGSGDPDALEYDLELG